MTSTCQNSLQTWGLTLVRVAVGVVFIMHGGQKLFVYHLPNVVDSFAKMGLPLPAVSATLSTVAEFGGGIALILGLLTRVGAAALAFNMLVAFLAVHARGGFFLPRGFEYVMVLFAANVALLLAGPGALALDNLLFGRCKAEVAPALPAGQA